MGVNGSLPHVDKDGLGVPLPSPIRRVLYLGARGAVESEVLPPPNPLLLTQLQTAEVIVYGIGSLFTSICPSLVLEVIHCSTVIPILLVFSRFVGSEANAILKRLSGMSAVRRVSGRLSRRGTRPRWCC